MVKAEVAAGLRTPWWRSTKMLMLEAIAVVGFAIGLIQMWPNILVEPGSPLIQGEAFSAPFKIVNGAYLPETTNTITFIRKLYVGGLHMKGTLAHNADFDNQLVERANPKTILINLESGSGRPTTAEIAIQVTYERFGFQRSQMYYFDGKYGDNWQWWSEPVTEELRKEFHAALVDKTEMERQMRGLH
jgi:hypothetical protein